MAAPAPEGSPGDLLTHGVDGDDDGVGDVALPGAISATSPRSDTG